MKTTLYLFQKNTLYGRQERLLFLNEISGAQDKILAGGDNEVKLPFNVDVEKMTKEERAEISRLFNELKERESKAPTPEERRNKEKVERMMNTRVEDEKRKRDEKVKNIVSEKIVSQMSGINGAIEDIVEELIQIENEENFLQAKKDEGIKGYKALKMNKYLIAHNVNENGKLKSRSTD